MIIDFGRERIWITGVTRFPTNFKCVFKASIIAPFFHLFDNINFFHVYALNLSDIFYFIISVLSERFMLLFDKNWDKRAGHSVDLSRLNSISDSIIDDIDWYIR